MDGPRRASIAGSRRAFDKAMADPACRDEAKKRNLTVEPWSGENLQRLVDVTLSAAPKIVGRAKQFLEWKLRAGRAFNNPTASVSYFCVRKIAVNVPGLPADIRVAARAPIRESITIRRRKDRVR